MESTIKFSESLTNREKKHIAHMRTACMYASLSHCNNAKVGAVIVVDDRPVVVGYNGVPQGARCECCEAENGRTLESVIHAEMNAIIFAARKGIPVAGATMYTTMAPCEACANALLQAQIHHVYYLNPYKNMAGVGTMIAAGVVCVPFPKQLLEYIV